MTTHRLFVPEALQPGCEIQLVDERAHYLGTVLRLRRGAELQVFNSQDGEFSAVVSSIGKNVALLEIGESRIVGVESPLQLHLVQGISRGERMDFVIQKATELGVKRITPALTERTGVKLDAQRAEKRREHWHKVAISACEQCGRTCPPVIDVPQSLQSWLRANSEGPDVRLMLRPGSEPLTTLSLVAIDKLCLLVGPEGGLTDNEYVSAEDAGFRPVSIGPRILRTETAAIVGLAIIQARWGDMSGR